MSKDQIVFELRKLNALFQDYFIDQDEYRDKAMDLVSQLGEKPYKEEKPCITLK